MMTTSLLTVAASVGVIAACGASPPSPRDQATPIWHRLVQCAHQHGMPDLPDPTINDQGQATFPNGTPTPPPSVTQACQAIYAQLPASARKDPVIDITAERKFAQCMRQQGVTDFPDPDSDGNFHLPASLSDSWKQGPRWPQISAAWNACKQYNPSGVISVAKS